ncbi:MAG: hypothetical protein IPP90_16320 [Gemmatimonadaceae bacterium]|nr:hypothetical protein [Gemmatimonadaceae bacterium]
MAELTTSPAISKIRLVPRWRRSAGARRGASRGAPGPPTASPIKLTFTPEVSSLDFSNGVVLSGFRIPAFRTRRITSTIDVRRDQSLIVSGLFSDDARGWRSGAVFARAGHPHSR